MKRPTEKTVMSRPDPFVFLFLLAWVPIAHAVTYANTSEIFSWIDASTHTKLGPTTGGVYSPTYKFLGRAETSGTYRCGTFLPFIDDAISDNIPLGFTFMFGGVNFTHVRIMTNGRLQFNNNLTCYYGSPVTQLPYPNTNLDYTLRVYGGDLDPSLQSEISGYSTPCTDRATCYVSYASLGTEPNRKFVVTWNNVPEWTTFSSATGNYNLQVILQENGEFIYQYGANTPGPGYTTGQVGWQVNSTDYDVPAVGYPASNSAIKFYIPQPVAEYRMEQSSWNGTPGEVYDTSGNGRHGVRVGNAQTTAAGKVCRGGAIPNNTNVAIDAIDTGIDIPGVVGGAGTITFWFKPKAWTGAGVQSNQLFDATTVNNQWFFLSKRRINNSNVRLHFRVMDSLGVLRSVETDNLTSAVLDPDGWVHIAVTWDFNALTGSNQDRLRIYVNGALAKTSAFTSSGTISGSIGTLYIGDNRSRYIETQGTSRSANGVIDEFRIYNTALGVGGISADMARTHPCIALHHLRIEHDGEGLTCMPEEVTIKACADTACTNLYNDSVTATLSPTGWEGGDAITFSGGTTTAKLRHTTAETVTLGASATVPTVQATRCFIGAAESCAMTFADSGFVFDVPTLIANKPSAAITVTAVKKDDVTETCAPAFSGARTVNFWSTYSDPATGSAVVSVNGTQIDTASPGTAIPLTFNGAAQAQITVRYPDAGKMQLDARYEGSGDEAGLIMTGNDQFVVTPEGLCVRSPDSNADCAAGDHTCSAFKKAGEPFNLTVKAVAWEADADTDLCNGNGATPNFRLSGIALGHERIAPDPGENGTPGVTSFDFLAADEGKKVIAQSISEVGVFKFTATPPVNAYFGETVAGGTSANIGRFYPADFLVNHTLVPACGGAFTYAGLSGGKAGQPFTVTGTITARNAAGNTTANYDSNGGFAKLTASGVTVVPMEDANPAAGTLSWNLASPISFSDGQSDFTATASYAFDAEGGPQTVHLRITADDGEASGEENDTGKAQEFRLGRLRAQNAYGPELMALNVPLQAEYYTAGDYYTINALDGCTVLTEGAHLLLSTDGSNWVSGDNTVSIASGSTGAALATASPLSGGDAGLSFSAPGAGNTGHLDLRTNIGTDYPWLLHDWNGDGVADEAQARINFGLYQGSPRHIYRRERY